jgi:hypothetical protein
MPPLIIIHKTDITDLFIDNIYEKKITITEIIHCCAFDV